MCSNEMNPESITISQMGASKLVKFVAYLIKNPSSCQFDMILFLLTSLKALCIKMKYFLVVNHIKTIKILNFNRKPA